MTKRTVDLDTAATILNIKKDTLRKRIQRGNIEAVKDRAGKWQVVLDDDIYSERDQGQDKKDKTRDTSQDKKDNVNNLLIDQLKSEVEYLRQENYRKDSIIMELTKKVPLLEAPQDRGLPWYRKIFNRGGDNEQE